MSDSQVAILDRQTGLIPLDICDIGVGDGTHTHTHSEQFVTSGVQHVHCREQRASASRIFVLGRWGML